MINTAVYVSDGNCISPLGMGITSNVDEIKRGNSGIQQWENPALNKEPFLGAILQEEVLETEFKALQYSGDFTKLEKMLLVALSPILKKHKTLLNDQCGIIFSTTKGNIQSLETDDISTYYLHQLARKISQTIGVTEEPIVLSNACVSGIMAISVAKRLIQTGKYKHCIVVGGDIFSHFVFSGFQSFQAVSHQPCKPYDKNRDGITLGEAAAAIWVSGEKSDQAYQIIGESSINDANHISGPSRTGEGLYLSIQNALKEAKIEATSIDAISAHGTATLYNDEMEAQAFNRCALEEKPTYSLKGYYGHTLGAAGLLETVIALRFADENSVPRSLGYEEHGVTLPLNITQENIQAPMNIILKTASGFGGSNTAVIFKKLTK